MSESTKVIARIEAADTEVELSTQDLLALSDSVPVDERDTGPALQPSMPAVIASPGRLDPPKASINGGSRLPLAIIVTVSIAGVTHVLMPSKRTDSSTTTSQQTSAAPEQIARDQPVRFANPFDSQEVFEFPPGTTETEARDAVAAVLKERAMSRQNPT